MRRGTLGLVLVAAMLAAPIWVAEAGAQDEHRGVDPTRG
jgi:hypothetical protein